MIGLGNIDDVYKHYLVVIEENQQLKDLLKECKKELKPLWDKWLYDYGDKTADNSDRFLRIDDLLNRINSVIGEKQ